MSSAISGLSTHFDTNSDLGSNFGTIFGPNESLSHDSHSQNQSIKSTEILRIVKSQETMSDLKLLSAMRIPGGKNPQ